MAINDILNRLSRNQKIDETNPDTYDTDTTPVEQDVETQLLAQEQNRETPLMMQGVNYTERPEREPILDRDAMFKSQAAVDEGINAPGVVESGETSQEEFDKLRGNPAVEPPKSKEQLILEQLQKMRQDSDEELKSAKSRDRWLSLANSLNNALSRFDQASVLKATRTPGMQAIAPGVLASTSSAKEVLAERQAKINELLQEQKLMAALQPKTMSKLDEAKIKEAEAKAKMYEAKSGPSAAKTEGEKVLDREFAKEYNKWQTGGKVDYVENKKIFEEAIDAIKKDKVDTGLLSGAGSKLPLVRTNTKQLETRVRKAINGMLRATLGAQFTEGEGERIFSQTFDPSADEEENIKNMQTELAKIEGRAKALEGQGKYFRENKTLTGYEPPSVQGAQKDDTIRKKIINGRSVSFKKTSEGWKEVK